MSNSRLAISTDNGNTWRITIGGPDLRFNTIHSVGDNLVAITHFYGGSRLYTPNLNTQTWCLRPLKDDGPNQTAINSLETWGDTEYLATNSGLFKHPIDKFLIASPNNLFPVPQQIGPKHDARPNQQ